MVTMNIPVDEALAQELELDSTRRLLSDIEHGRREIAEGRFHTSDEVRAELARRREERQK